MSGGQFHCAAEIASEMDFRKDSQRHFLRCKILARLLMGNSIAPLSFHLRWIFSKGAKSLDMSQNSARFSARFSAAQSNCAPECPKKVKVALLPLSLESLPRSVYAAVHSFLVAIKGARTIPCFACSRCPPSLCSPVRAVLCPVMPSS